MYAYYDVMFCFAWHQQNIFFYFKCFMLIFSLTIRETQPEIRAIVMFNAAFCQLCDRTKKKQVEVNLWHAILMTDRAT